MAMHYLDYEENEEQCFKTWSAGGRRISEEDAQRVYPDIYSADYEITTDHKDRSFYPTGRTHSLPRSLIPER